MWFTTTMLYIGWWWFFGWYDKDSVSKVLITSVFLFVLVDFAQNKNESVFSRLQVSWRRQVQCMRNSLYLCKQKSEAKQLAQTGFCCAELAVHLVATQTLHGPIIDIHRLSFASDRQQQYYLNCDNKDNNWENNNRIAQSVSKQISLWLLTKIIAELEYCHPVRIFIAYNINICRKPTVLIPTKQ